MCIHRKYSSVRILKYRPLKTVTLVTSVYTSGEASRNRYIKIYYDWNVQIISGEYRIIVTYILHINDTDARDR